MPLAVALTAGVTVASVVEDMIRASWVFKDCGRDKLEEVEFKAEAARFALAGEIFVSEII